ncbi:MAG TPA: crosslink repair DNA glycosylase YcaQ family protein, partial [Povalibacter sp.]|nr:crosslink repair DNA glycosylase YcaQ family protein [Povalibacter sp.]
QVRRANRCHLLPVYDEYTVGYADRSACLDPAHAARIVTGNGIFRAPVVINGRIVGSWTRELGKERVEIRVTPLTRLTGVQLQAIKQAAARYGKFLGLAATVKTGR